MPPQRIARAANPADTAAWGVRERGLATLAHGPLFENHAKSASPRRGCRLRRSTWLGLALQGAAVAKAGEGVKPRQAAHPNPNHNHNPSQPQPTTVPRQGAAQLDRVRRTRIACLCPVKPEAALRGRQGWAGTVGPRCCGLNCLPTLKVSTIERFTPWHPHLLRLLASQTRED